MSNFLLGLAGAALGSAFGMPAVGYAVGSGLGTAFGHHHHAAPHPPLARDLSVQTQAEGVGIPRVWGLLRLAGNILWASDSIESQGALYANLAIGLCEGPIAGLRRVWASDKEIFTLPPESKLLRSQYPPHFRFYPGNEEQLPDPLLEAREGKGKAPAFRGLAYLVLEHFPLAAFNNTLPTFTVEVVQSAVLVESSENYQPLAEEQEKSNTVQPPILTPCARQNRHAPRSLNKPLQKQPSVPLAPLQVPCPVPLASVVTDLCLAAGFPLESIDTTALQTVPPVTGFVLASPTPARAALQVLQAAYGFVTVQVGGVLKATLLKQERPPLILSTTDCGAGEESQASPVPLFWSRSPRAEIPFTLTLGYIDSLMGKTASVTLRRSGVSADFGRTEQVDVPLVLTPQEASDIAERLLSQADAERVQVAFALPRSYTFLEPGDRVVLQNQIYRITAIELGRPGIVRVSGVREREQTPGCCLKTPS